MGAISASSSNRSGIVNLYVSLAKNPVYDAVFLGLLILAELVLGLAIIRFVTYTEIDWEAYMQEVEIWLAGEYDYRKIYGGTGPLVYPAGFLYLFALLRWMTDSGKDVKRAQYFFLAFYLAIQATVLLLVQQCVRSVRSGVRGAGKTGNGSSSGLRGGGKTGNDSSSNDDDDDDLALAHHIWSWRIAMGCLCLSKRVHSIFMLRLFNDGITMLLLYVSMLLFTRNRWNTGCFVFSLAVSIKMNVLLFAPGLLLLLLQVGPDLKTVFYRLMLCCALPQLVLGAPFLLTFPVSYLRKAFELDRVFFYKWTVNFKFLPEETFLSKQMALLLLALHLSGLFYCAVRWLQATKQQTGQRIFLTLTNQRLSAHYIIYTMLISNFIGICFARTLHYQFYIWYFHALPFLLWTQDAYPIPIRLALMGAIEYAFLTFPATPTSSAVLQVAHAAILLRTSPPPVLEDNDRETEARERRKIE